MVFMEWRVIKMGSSRFDTLHAYGFGLLLEYAYEQPILLEDEGCWYRLSHDSSRLIHTSCDVLDEIIKLPAEFLLEERDTPLNEQTLLLSNLDGLLAALFTYPAGIRAFSFDDVRQKYRFDTSVPARSLMKVQNCSMHWKSLLTSVTRDPSHWLDDALRDYHPAHPQEPFPMPKRRKTDMTVPMTLDPSFSYDLRRPRSDGATATKVNMTVRGTRFAVLLAHIGAMRFLRAQQVSGDVVIYTLPVATRLLFSPGLSPPMLTHAGHLTLESALLVQSIEYVLASPASEATWHTLAFQVLQQQGKQQSISVQHGSVDIAWLEHVKTQIGRGPLLFWRRLLHTAQKDLPYEQDCLEDALLSQRATSYLAHLKDIARLATHSALDDKKTYAYHLKDVHIIMNAMKDSDQLPLRSILERKTGTLRFGRALRLLKSSRPAAAREVLDALEEVQTRDQLIRAVYWLTEACVLLAAETDYVIVPSDEDFFSLAEDVTSYGAYTIAGILMLLSSLRYPRSEESPQRDALMLWRLLRAVLQAIAPEMGDSTSPLPVTSVSPPVSDTFILEGEYLDDSNTDHYI